ncbi:hypothetical protein BFU36_00445 [Sulfolobus sp. A20]|nr:hypothetical protein BFU36_00445 [Sulfolobus sp. A20]
MIYLPIILDNLNVYYDSLHVIKGVSFNLDDSIAILGPSGSGKTTIGKAILKILPPISRVSGKIFIDDVNVIESDIKHLRWKVISYIPQGGSYTYLNPVRKITDHIKLICRANNISVNVDELKYLMDNLGLSQDLLNRYPYQLSGGEIQRILILIALLPKPKYIIADEPTSSLDVISQLRVLRVLNEYKKKFNSRILLITHDLLVAYKMSKEVIIISQGKIVESGNINEIIENPKNKLTKKIVEGSMIKRRDQL